jgi:tetratricopeptide (TPR) repeat protein
MSSRCLAVIAVVLVMAPQGAAIGQTSAPAIVQPAPTLDEMMAQHRANAGDDALRERIIARVAQSQAKPAIPEDARRASIQGNAAFADATGPSDYQRAAARFEQALTAAPWWGDMYLMQAKAYEKLGDFDLAMRSLRFYILTAPPAAEVRKAQDQIYVLEDKKAASAQQRADEAARAEAEKTAREASVWVALEGARYVCPEQRATRLVTAQLSVSIVNRVVTEHLRVWDNTGRELRGGTYTRKVTAIAGDELLLSNNQRLGPTSAFIEGVAAERSSSGPMIVCPRQ